MLRRKFEDRKTQKEARVDDRIRDCFDILNKAISDIRSCQYYMGLAIDHQNYQLKKDPKVEKKTFTQWDQEAEIALDNVKKGIDLYKRINEDLRDIFYENKKSFE